MPKKTRRIKGKKVGGGRGKEVDFLSTDGRERYYWVEVSVSPNLRLPGGADNSRRRIIYDAAQKFADEKIEWLRSNFGIKNITKWFIYSPRLFTFFAEKSEEEKHFCKSLRKRKIEPISFGKVLKEVFEELNYMGYDTPRQYLFLLKKFGYKTDRI